MLRGRREECALLDRMLEGARAGRSGTLVLRGAPGIGKTALLDYAIESARDLRVLRAIGVESEMELAFAVLHQLCAPMALLDRLPGPQRDALAITFGLSEGAARVALYRLRRRFGAELRAEVAATVGDPSQVESELRFLLDVLAGPKGSGTV